MLRASQQVLAYLYPLEAEPAVRCPRKASATLTKTDRERAEVVGDGGSWSCETPLTFSRLLHREF